MVEYRCMRRWRSAKPQDVGEAALPDIADLQLIPRDVAIERLRAQPAAIRASPDCSGAPKHPGWAILRTSSTIAVMAAEAVLERSGLAE
jgi:hypothetical protein